MVKFVTLIQLHAANENDYARLHREMEKESFTITNNYKARPNTILNAEEYKRNGETLKDINDAVFRAAGRIGKKYAFTVRKEKRI